MSRRLIVACVGGLLLGGAGLSADCPELVGRWPFGATHAVAVSGDHAYFGSGTALMVADVSDPSAPLVVGQVGLPDHVGDVAVSGGYAYLADGQWGLRVIDVRAPSAPVEVGIVDTPGSAFGVAVSRGYAYVACGGFGHPSSGLRVIDVSVPSAPVEVGFVGTLDYAFDVAASGGYAFLAASGFVCFQ